MSSITFILSFLDLETLIIMFITKSIHCVYLVELAGKLTKLRSLSLCFWLVDHGNMGIKWDLCFHRLWLKRIEEVKDVLEMPCAMDSSFYAS